MSRTIKFAKARHRTIRLMAAERKSGAQAQQKRKKEQNI